MAKRRIGQVLYPPYLPDLVFWQNAGLDKCCTLHTYQTLFFGKTQDWTSVVPSILTRPSFLAKRRIVQVLYPPYLPDLVFWQNTGLDKCCTLHTYQALFFGKTQDWTSVVLSILTRPSFLAKRRIGQVLYPPYLPDLVFWQNAGLDKCCTLHTYQTLFFGKTQDWTSLIHSILTRPSFLAKHRIGQVLYPPYLPDLVFWQNAGLDKCCTLHTYQT